MHRNLRQPLATAVRAEGIHVYDAEGRAYIDACGGAAVSCLGHGHPRIREAILRQLDAVAYAHTSFFTTEAAERLADRLVADAPPGIGHAMILSGGSEAVEAALKMARQYHVERGEPQRVHVIARRQSYHGNTLGALATGGNEGRRTAFRPLLIETHHVGPCFAYRYMRPGESEADYAARAAQELEDEIQRLGPDRVIAFVAETVVGATAGAVPPVGDYFKRVRAICDRHGVLLILDEVMSGMGRTGTLHACEQEGISPDIEVIGKGLGAGYEPVSALLISDEVYRAFVDGSGAFSHGHTYMGHPVAAAAALAVQEVIAEDDLLANVRRQGDHLRRALEARFGNSPHVGDIRGRGLFIGLELVQDRASREPFDPALQLHARLKKAALGKGLMIYPSGGTIDGRRGDHVLLAPPFILTEDQADEIVLRLEETLDDVIRAL